VCKNVLILGIDMTFGGHKGRSGKIANVLR
jgi:hypothetical protein